jgi:YggT family protein
MFVVGNLVQAIAVVLDVVLQTLLLVILINALLSWVRPDPSNPIVMFLERVSDLVCNPIRRLIPTNVSGIDFAPFVASWDLVRQNVSGEHPERCRGAHERPSPGAVQPELGGRWRANARRRRRCSAEPAPRGAQT